MFAMSSSIVMATYSRVNTQTHVRLCFYSIYVYLQMLLAAIRVYVNVNVNSLSHYLGRVGYRTHTFEIPIALFARIHLISLIGQYGDIYADM